MFDLVITTHTLVIFLLSIILVSSAALVANDLPVWKGRIVFWGAVVLVLLPIFGIINITFIL